MLVQITPAQLKYLQFLEAHKIEEEKIYVNQNQAFRRFGRGNVERWRAQGKIRGFKRPNTLDFKMSELLDAAANQQDY